MNPAQQHSRLVRQAAKAGLQVVYATSRLGQRDRRMLFVCQGRRAVCRTLPGWETPRHIAALKKLIQEAKQL